MERSNTTILFIIISLLFIAGCQPSTDDVAVEEEEKKYAIPVETAQVTQADVSSFYSTTATLEAPEEAHVMTRIAGIINSIKVEEGDKVTQGQLLAVIDAKRQEFDFNRSQAEVKIIEQELNRLKKMNNKEFISQDAMAKLEFKLQAAKAQRDLAQLQVKESFITSPIDGVIAKRHVKVGNMAKEFEQLFYVVKQDQLYGIVHLPEQQLASLALGQQATIISQHTQNAALPNVLATVLRISPVIDAQSGTFKVTLAIDNQDSRLKAGMFTRVELKYDTHKNVLTVPFNALINQDNVHALYVINDTVAERREVTLGYREHNIVEIVSGVDAGESVVIRGQQNLKDQSLIEIVTPLGQLANSQNADQQVSKASSQSNTIAAN
ncbi:efflux RND transporter periplasmic adaptor subunit [Shewanella intestini]|uniref:Efflux RND transporter periplasmic adaptor subunit n=1 Tax=Shewanella intestini TaxID=2017544 RepID=A0ABS5HZ58_9GAMM|nr:MULTISPECIES: efflux RND transporter periplasmic adaptor subunit [Shewanella]MBR9727032.1 efflux RND transporter periplasmic adaptor subunit [Shewanella intestini]MRG35833.1 efflux RND transporter periplasmic adaptor subunit [Shewanella sp. XMDDZSB0408]